MCKNEQQPEMESCFEERGLRSRSYGHENQERWSRIRVNEKEKIRSWSSFIFTTDPQPWYNLWSLVGSYSGFHCSLPSTNGMQLHVVTQVKEQAIL